MEAIDNPRSAPLTCAELAALGAEPTPADCLDDCMHAAACTRVWEVCSGCEVNTEASGWMDELAAALQCADCECYER